MRFIFLPSTERRKRAICFPMRRRSSGTCSSGWRACIAIEWSQLMSKQTIKKPTRARVADEIMAGMRELDRMMDLGKTPSEMFTVRTVEVPDPNIYRARQVRQLREALGTS